jgi:hypothetical protein
LPFAACPNCGTFNRPSVRVCTNCRASIPEEPGAAPSPHSRALLHSSSGSRLTQLGVVLPVVMVLGAVAAYWLRPAPVCVISGDFYAHRPQWSPDGTRIAFVIGAMENWNRAELAVYDLAARTHRVVSPLDRADGPLFAWSPDGRRLAFALDGHLTLVAADGTGAPRILAAASGPRFTADGRRLLAHCAPAAEGIARFYCEIEVSTGATDLLPALAFDPGDASALHMLELDRAMPTAVGVVDLTTGEKRAVVDTSPRIGGDPLQVGWAPLWTPDGVRILYPSGVDIWTVMPDGTQREAVLLGIPGVDLSTVAIGPGGERVYFSAPVPGAQEAVSQAVAGEMPGDLYAAERKTGRTWRYENVHPFKRRFQLSPDGRRIVYERRRPHKNTSAIFWCELWLLKT